MVLVVHKTSFKKKKTWKDMKAFKGFEIREDGDMWCKDFKYEIGKTYKYNGDISLCHSGFHACRNLHQVWQFYPNNRYNVFCEVECGGEIKESNYNDGKIVCSEITIVRKVDVSNIPIFHDPLFYSEGYMMVRGKTGYNYIDKNGNFLSKHWFDNGLSMQDGWAAVTLRNKWNFINSKGGFLLRSGVDYVESFARGLALLKDNHRYNLIDTKGNLKFDEWQHDIKFRHGSWEVEIDGNWIKIED